MSKSDSKKPENPAYYIDSQGKTHYLGIKDLTYLPSLDISPEIEESVDKFGAMSWRSTFKVKVATPDQLIALGVDIAEAGGDWSAESKPNKISEEMDF